MTILAVTIISLLIAIVATECRRQVLTYRGWTERLDRLVMK